MIRLKISGAALLSALAFSALIGVGTASATELCSTRTDPCSGTMYGAGTALKVSLVAGSSATFTSTIATVACKQFDFSGVTRSTGGPSFTVTGEITAATLGGCTDNLGAPCNAKAQNLAWAFEIHAVETASGNGTMTMSPPAALIECEGGVDCTFSVTSALLNVTGGSPARLKAIKVPLTPKPSGTHTICPSGTVYWSAEWAIATPSPLFVM